MMIVRIVLISILLLINIIGFILVWIDKEKSIHNKWRIPEKVFMIFSVLGGGIAVYLACRIFRHKTKHAKFMIGIPVIVIVQLGIVLWILVKL